MYSRLLLPERGRQEQQGATLVIALTVVMVAALLAVTTSHDFLVMSRHVDNRLEAAQVNAYLKGAEAVARQVLLQDMQLTPEVDGSGDIWAQTLELQLPEGSLKACLADLQGRLNLNDLNSPPGDGFSPEQRRFIRLLQVLELDDPLTRSEAISLGNAVFDWIDPDDQQRFPGGAEDLFYMQQDPAGKAANQPFSSISELRMIRGMSAEIVAALTPHVTLWGNGFLNINSADRQFTLDGIQEGFTASERPSPVVLRTLNVEQDLTPLPEDLARQIANRRLELGGFSNGDMLEQGQVAGVSLQTQALGLGSDFFLLVSEIDTGSRRYQMQSVLFRNIDAVGVPGVRVMMRQPISQRLDMDEFCVN